jgi:hypothetical protein
MDKFATIDELSGLSTAIQEIDLKLAGDLEKCASNLKKIKVAQYVGAQGYWIRNSRCWGNCYRQKRAKNKDMAAQEVWKECHKEYLASIGNDKSGWEKYAEEGSNKVLKIAESNSMVKNIIVSEKEFFNSSLRNKIGKYDTGSSIALTLEEGSYRFASATFKQLEKVMDVAEALAAKGKKEQAMKIVNVAEKYMKEQKVANWLTDLFSGGKKKVEDPRGEYLKTIQKLLMDYINEPADVFLKYLSAALEVKTKRSIQQYFQPSQVRKQVNGKPAIINTVAGPGGNSLVALSKAFRDLQGAANKGEIEIDIDITDGAQKILKEIYQELIDVLKETDKGKIQNHIRNLVSYHDNLLNFLLSAYNGGDFSAYVNDPQAEEQKKKETSKEEIKKRQTAIMNAATQKDGNDTNKTYQKAVLNAITKTSEEFNKFLTFVYEDVDDGIRDEVIDNYLETLVPKKEDLTPEQKRQETEKLVQTHIANLKPDQILKVQKAIRVEPYSKEYVALLDAIPLLPDNKKADVIQNAINELLAAIDKAATPEAAPADVKTEAIKFLEGEVKTQVQDTAEQRKIALAIQKDDAAYQQLISQISGARTEGQKKNYVTLAIQNAQKGMQPAAEDPRKEVIELVKQDLWAREISQSYFKALSQNILGKNDIFNQLLAEVKNGVDKEHKKKIVEAFIEQQIKLLDSQQPKPAAAQQKTPEQYVEEWIDANFKDPYQNRLLHLKFSEENVRAEIVKRLSRATNYGAKKAIIQELLVNKINAGKIPAAVDPKAQTTHGIQDAANTALRAMTESKSFVKTSSVFNLSKRQK